MIGRHAELDLGALDHQRTAARRVGQGRRYAEHLDRTAAAAEAPVEGPDDFCLAVLGAGAGYVELDHASRRQRRDECDLQRNVVVYTEAVIDTR